MSPDHAISVDGSGTRIHSARLVLRPWSTEDAEAALAVYGADEVARWLSPAMDRVRDADAMRGLLDRWIDESQALSPPEGRWAIQLAATGVLVGGIALLP